jgi:hypothetical protein
MMRNDQVIPQVLIKWEEGSSDTDTTWEDADDITENYMLISTNRSLPLSKVEEFYFTPCKKFL